MRKVWAAEDEHDGKIESDYDYDGVGDYLAHSIDASDIHGSIQHGAKHRTAGDGKDAAVQSRVGRDGDEAAFVEEEFGQSQKQTTMASSNVRYQQQRNNSNADRASVSMEIGSTYDGDALIIDGHPVSSGVKGILMLLLFIHLLGLLVWFRIWLRDRKTKYPTMKVVPPPPKQTCTYDMDRAYALSKLELPLKALKLAKS